MYSMKKLLKMLSNQIERISLMDNNNYQSKKKPLKQLAFDELMNMSSTDGKQDILDQKKAETNTGNFLAADVDVSFPREFVRDFDQFIDYLENHTIQLTRAKEYIARKHLFAINQLMSVRNEKATVYTDQEYYSYLHFFYFLAFSGQLFEKTEKRGKPYLQLTVRAELYKELNDIEKYFFLLETFWVDVNWAKLTNDSWNVVGISVQEVLYKFSQKKAGYIIELRKNKKMREWAFSNNLFDWKYILLYFEWLGFWKCKMDRERIERYGSKKYYFAESLKLTAFGLKIMPILLFERNFQIWNIAERRLQGEFNPVPGAESENMIFTELSDETVDAIIDRMEEDQSSQPFYLPFKSLFPNESIDKTLPRNIPQFKKGIYTFKISFAKDVWRKVVLSGEHTMEDLHEMILDAYDFDYDHLYAFYLDGQKWSDDCISSPHDIGRYPEADDVFIGDIGLVVEQQLLYLYDFGDEWTFQVKVEGIEEGEPEPFDPFIKESKGDAPQQYFYEEEYDELYEEEYDED